MNGLILKLFLPTYTESHLEVQRGSIKGRNLTAARSYTYGDPVISPIFRPLPIRKGSQTDLKYHSLKGCVTTIVLKWKTQEVETWGDPRYFEESFNTTIRRHLLGWHCKKTYGCATTT